jgi:hypothetical protein
VVVSVRNYLLSLNPSMSQTFDVMGLMKKINEHVSESVDKTQFYASTHFQGVGFKIHNYSCWSNNSEALFRKLKLEIYFRKKSSKTHTPIYIITKNEKTMNELVISDCNQVNIFFILVSFSQVIDKPDLLLLTEDVLKDISFESKSEKGSFVLPITRNNSYSINAENSTVLTTETLSLDYVMTINELIFAVENDYLKHYDNEITKVVNSQSKEECLSLLMGKQEILGFMRE